MDEAWDLLIFTGVILFIAAIIGLITWGPRYLNKRDNRSTQQWQQLLQFVSSRGWAHAAQASGDRYCGGDPIPTKGTNIPVRDHITGEFRGRAVSCFERHARVTNTGGPDSVRYSAVFAVTLPTPVPRLVIKKPQALDKVNARADAVFSGGKVMELGDPAFDEKFRLTANDEKFARMLLTGPLTHFLMSDDRAEEVPLRFQGDVLLTWCRGRLRAEHIEQKLNYLCDVLDHWSTQAQHTP